MEAVNQGSNMLRFVIWTDYKLPSTWTHEWERGRLGEGITIRGLLK